MKRKFATNLLLLIILNLLIKPYWVFGIDRTVQNLVGSSEYGLFFSLFNFTLLFNFLLDLGITNYNNRQLSANPSGLRSYIGHLIVIRVLLGVIFGVVTITMALLLGYEKRQLWLLFILIINQFLAAFILYLRSNISGMQLFTTDSFLSVLDRLIMIVLCWFVLWGHVLSVPFSIEWFAYIQTISYSISLAVVLTIVLIRSKGFSPSFQFSTAKKIFNEVKPYALLMFLMAFYGRADNVMIERLHHAGALETGIYAHSVRILDALSMFSYLFPSLLLPMFSRLFAESLDTKPLVRFAFSILFFVAVTTSVVLSVYSHFVIKKLYHENVTYSAEVFRVLIVGFIPISLSLIFGTLLTARGKLAHLNYIAFGSVVLNFIANMLLIPSLGAMGAAITNVATQSVSCLLLIYVCQNQKLVVFTRADVARCVFFVLVSVSFALGAALFVKPEVAKILFSIAGIFVAGIAFKILPVSEVKMKFKEFGTRL